MHITRDPSLNHELQSSHAEEAVLPHRIHERFTNKQVILVSHLYNATPVWPKKLSHASLLGHDLRTVRNYVQDITLEYLTAEVLNGLDLGLSSLILNQCRKQNLEMHVVFYCTYWRTKNAACA